MNSIKVLVTALLSSLTTTAFCDIGQPYFGVGYDYVLSSDLSKGKTGLDGKVDSNKPKTPLILIGIQASKSFSLEAEYLYGKGTYRVGDDPNSKKYDSHTASLFVAYRKLISENIYLKGRLGAGFNYTDYKQIEDIENNKKWDVNYGFGLGFRATSNINLEVSYDQSTQFKGIQALTVFRF